MLRIAQVLVFSSLSFVGSACDDSPTGNTNGEDFQGFQLRLIATASVPINPEGLALSADGEWLAVPGEDGDAVHLLDAETYELIAVATGFGSPVGVAFSRGNDLLVVGTKDNGTIGLELPSLTERFRVQPRSLTVITDPIEDGYYVNGRGDDVVRLSPNGEETARSEIGNPLTIALAPDGGSVFVASTFPASRVTTLRTPSLEIADQQPSPLTAEVLVPLRSGNVKAIGRPVGEVGPTLALLYDPVRGELGAVDTVRMDAGVLTFGGGSPWAAIGGGFVVVPFNLGTLVLDDTTGEQVDFLEMEDLIDLAGAPPCCDVVYDPQRDRAILTSFPTDQILIFEIDRF
jgi:hypothetical protein